MPADKRAQALLDFRNGIIQVMVNVAVLTEGFDDPGVSCIAMARPTRSEGLYAQCVGRGTRLAPGKQNCLVLDFVDLAGLSLCTLPSLFGAPRDLDLQGREVLAAGQKWRSLLAEHPGFELEAGAVTLEEIQERAESFDPLRLTVDAEVRAISANAWFSLGRYGVGLHFERASGRVSEALVLRYVAPPKTEESGKKKALGFRRSKGWQVQLDDKVMDVYATMEEAVAAVDYELSNMGKSAALSALASSAWRKEEAPEALLAEATRLEAPKTGTYAKIGARAETLQRIVWAKIVARRV
jgi:ATP-dependent helicase IRC3